jgi:hypothetical protein
MVEFALLAPVLFLLLFGIIVAAIVVTNMVQLQNTVRDAARAAAVCGGGPARKSEVNPPTMPGGLSCDSANLVAFFNQHLSAIPAGSVKPFLCVEINGASCTGVLATSTNVFDQCNSGETIEVQGSYAQPLYLPLVGHLLGDSGGNTRTLSASATAVCEQ